LLPYAGDRVADFFDDGVTDSIHCNVGRLDYRSPLLGIFNNEFAGNFTIPTADPAH
jgi:hypothetical protein